MVYLNNCWLNYALILDFLIIRWIEKIWAHRDYLHLTVRSLSLSAPIIFILQKLYQPFVSSLLQFTFNLSAYLATLKPCVELFISLTWLFLLRISQLFSYRRGWCLCPPFQHFFASIGLNYLALGQSLWIPHHLSFSTMISCYESHSRNSRHHYLFALLCS